jgi:uncharacterized protein (DUF1015 family)
MPPRLAMPCDNRAPSSTPLAPLGEKAIRVPDLAPFRGLRYTAGPDLTAVTAPPYDVIDADERAALLAEHPNNAVRLILPEGTADDAYDVARDTLAAWRADGTLAPDATPALYAYRMDAPRPGGGTHRTVGVIGALGLPAGSVGGDVLPHERTLPKAKSDRLALLRATRANFDPIWGLTLAGGLSDLAAGAPPVARSVDPAGVVHELGIIDDDERIAAVRALVASQPMVLADGHHRFDTACTYRAEVGAPGAEAILCLVMSLDDAQLDVRPFHRLVRGAPADLRERLGAHWGVRPFGAPTPEVVGRLVAAMEGEDGLGLVDEGGAALLTPIPPLAPVVAEMPEPLRDVDAARFDASVRPLLDGATLAYRSDAASVAGMVVAGEADAALLLRGVTVEQIRAAADARVLMPEKTTYFAPKPRTGMVMRAFDDNT